MPISLNWPDTGLDSLPKPGASTKTNDTGYFLDEIITAFATLLEEMEARWGYDESSPQGTPLADTVLTSLTNGKSKWGKVLTAMLAANAVTQSVVASGVTSSPTTTTGPVDLTDMSATLTTTGGDLLAICVASMASSVTNAINSLGLRLDSGADLFGQIFYSHASAGYVVPAMTIGRFTGVSAASHTIKARWSTNSGTLTAFGAYRHLIVVELKK